MAQGALKDGGRTDLRRHDLVFFALDKVMSQFPESQQIQHLLAAGVPGIIKAQPAELGPERLELGLSSPVRRDGLRQRFVICVAKEQIRRKLNPEQVLAQMLAPSQGAITESRSGRQSELTELLGRIKKAADQSGFQVGVYGSTALEGLTGLPYLHANSDLDLYFYPQRPVSPKELAEFCHYLECLVRQCGHQLDGEIYIGQGESVKLKELAARPRTVLAKGLYGARLAAWEEAWEQMMEDIKS